MTTILQPFLHLTKIEWFSSESRGKQATLKAWSLSLCIHGTLITLAVLLTNNIKPIPEPNTFKWDIALIEPALPQPVKRVTQPAKTMSSSVKNVPAPTPTTQRLSKTSRIERQAVQMKTVTPMPTAIHRMVQQRMTHTSVAVSQQQITRKTQSRPTKIVRTALAIHGSQPIRHEKIQPTLQNPGILTMKSESLDFLSRSILHTKTSPQIVQPVTQVSLQQENQAVEYQRVSQQTPQSVTPISHIHQTVVNPYTSMKMPRQEQPSTIIRPVLTTSASHSEQKPLAKRMPMQTQAPTKAFTSVTKSISDTRASEVMTSGSIHTYSTVTGNVEPIHQIHQPRVTKTEEPLMGARRHKTLLHSPRKISHRTTSVVHRKRTVREISTAQGPSAALLAFLNELRQKIEQAQEYPMTARQMGWEGISMVKLAFLTNGDLQSLDITEPSGHPSLDEAALSTIRKILPLTPPVTVGGKALSIEIPISFQMD